MPLADRHAGVRRRRAAFTLLELTAALALVGFVLLGGMLLIDQVGDSATRIAHDGSLAAHEGNGARLLARLLVDATASTDSTKPFRGDEHGVELWTSCDAPGGWTAPCRASLALDTRADSSVVLAELSTGESFALRAFAGRAELRYYNPQSPTDTAWVRQWSSNVTLPAAVGIVLVSDTIVLPVSASRD